MRISQQQSDQFARDGFLTHGDFLDPLATQVFISAVENLQPDEQATRTRRGAAFARRNLLDCAFVRELTALPYVAELLEQIGNDFIGVRAILFDKTGAANWSVPWHQDRSIAVREQLSAPGFGPWSRKAGVVHVQPPVEILQQMVTLRFHLDPCGPENGPLRVIAGTHQRLLDPHEVETKSSRENQIACTVNAGGLVVMRPLILHASSPARVPSHRRVIHIEFGPRELPHRLHWAFVERGDRNPQSPILQLKTEH